MDTLSSCYFCGTALDEPLSTYRLAAPDDSAVCLCQGCHGKLETVVAAAGVCGSVLAGSGEETTAATESRDGDETNPTTPAAADEDEPLDDEPITPEADASDILVDPETDDEADVGATGKEASLDEESESELPEGFGTVDITGGEESPGGDDEDVTDGSAGASPETTPQHDDEPGASDEQSTGGTGHEEEDDTGDEPAVTDTPDTTGSDGDADGSGLAARTTLTALEYNKVMRLLQNREFPVDREEIETVASNAYELRRSECAEVLDLAVDRGLIDEEDGQLRRPTEE